MAHAPRHWIACPLDLPASVAPQPVSIIAGLSYRFFDKTHAFSPEDAALIAAAPDLLDALITALPYIECAEEDEAYKPGVVAKVTKQVRETIAKATGK